LKKFEKRLDIVVLIYYVVYMPNSLYEMRAEARIKKKQKPCARCKKIKHFRHFYRDKKSLDGRRSWCKQCLIEYNKRYTMLKIIREIRNKGKALLNGK